VLGGTQSLHVSGYDEAYDIPSEDAMMMSLRTQQIIGHESGTARTIDPLAGSYFVESLTNTLEKKAWEYISKIETIGKGSMREGVLTAIEKGYIEKEIAEAAYAYQERVEKKNCLIVGVNAYQSEIQQPIEVFEFDPKEGDRQKERLEKVKKSRNQGDVDKALDKLRRAVEKNENLMPVILEALKVYTTEGEVMGTLRELYGEYKDPAVF
jgi:methylmalonyl-CoA mutase N-terminal domain/subunit